jgi:triacylglycerol lipase
MKKLLGLLLLLALAGLGAAAFYAWRSPTALLVKSERSQLGRAGFVKKVIAAPAGTLTYWEKGTGVTAILIHDAGDQAGAWSKVAPDLAESYQVQVLDLPGHGESSPEAGPISLSDEVKGLESLLEASSRGKATLVGNGMGVWVAMLYARQHPERVERIVAVNGGPFSGNLRAQRPPESREQAREMVTARQDPGSPLPPDFVLDDMVRSAHRGPIARLMQTAAEMPNYLMDDKLRNFMTPVDIVWGQADQSLESDYAQKMQSGLPLARLTPIKNCGHTPQRECPLALAAVLKHVLELPVPTPQVSLERKPERKPASHRP